LGTIRSFIGFVFLGIPKYLIFTNVLYEFYYHKIQTINLRRFLITVSKASHSAHHAENVVVHGVDADLGGVDTGDSVVGERKVERGIVNAGEVARA